MRDLRGNCYDLQQQMDHVGRKTLNTEQELVVMEKQIQVTRQERNLLVSELQQRQQSADALELTCDQLRALLKTRNRELLQPQSPPNPQPPRRNTTEPAVLKQEIKLTHEAVSCGTIGAQGQTFRGGDKSGKLPTSAENSKVLNDLKMLRDG